MKKLKIIKFNSDSTLYTMNMHINNLSIYQINKYINKKRQKDNPKEKVQAGSKIPAHERGRHEEANRGYIQSEVFSQTSKKKYKTGFSEP